MTTQYEFPSAQDLQMASDSELSWRLTQTVSPRILSNTELMSGFKLAIETLLHHAMHVDLSDGAEADHMNQHRLAVIAEISERIVERSTEVHING